MANEADLSASGMLSQLHEICPELLNHLFCINLPQLPSYYAYMN